MSHNIIDDKTGKVYTADIEFDDSLGFSVIDQAKKDLNASGMGSGLVNTGSFMDPQWLVIFLLVVLIGVAGWYFYDKRSKQQEEQAGSDINSIVIEKSEPVNHPESVNLPQSVSSTPLLQDDKKSSVQ